MSLDVLARSLVVIGVIIALLGVLLWVFGNAPFLGRLPGDISFQRGNFRFYAPIVTSLVLSLILTIVLNLVARR